MPDSYTVHDLFEAYVFMRRQGTTPDYALTRLQDLRRNIPETERYELAHLLRQWEKSEGALFFPDPSAQAQPPQRQRTPGREGLITCPKCHRMHSSQALYCYYCGTLLTRTGTPFILYDPDGGKGTDFGANASLVFTIRHFEQNPLQLKIPGNDPLIIGRNTEDSVMIPDIDLKEYNGQELGVSRVHAMLQRRGSAVTLSDMGSLNYTFLNGERIFPQEARILGDGNEIRLGRMAITVRFVL
jgi:hypothetical protein